MSSMLLDTLNGEPIGQERLPETDPRGHQTPQSVCVPDTVGITAPQNGGLEAFLASIEGRAYRVAQIALWDHELALDVVQDSMLRLVENYRDKPSTEWPALFFTILRNRVNDVRRRRQTQERVARFIPLFGRKSETESDEEVDLLELGLGADDSVRDSGPENELGARRLRQSIEAAVRRLPERQRQVFLLRDGQELSVRETAQILGCSDGTVKQHHFRALQTLRRLLAEVWDHE